MPDPLLKAPSSSPPAVSLAGLFFTGTDTGVGKTVVTAAVARLLMGQAHKVGICKPVATGARRIGDQWVAEDTERLAEAVGGSLAWEAITPWTFPDPVAPSVAAQRGGVTLSLDDMADAVERQCPPEGVVLVEGVGGLLCPLTEEETVIDLAARLRLPLVIVARRSLGTLNHTLMTCAIARQRGLFLAGVVVSETTPPHGLAEETNIQELQRLGVPLLAVLPHGKDVSAEQANSLAQVDWWSLCFSRCSMPSPEPRSETRWRR